MVKKEKVNGGKQTIVTSTGRDDSNHKVPNGMGGKMGGSITNLSHSLVGASAEQRGPGTAGSNKKNRFD